MSFSDKLSVVGILLSILSIIVTILLGIYIYKKQKQSQEIMDEFFKKSLEQLRTYEQASFDVLVGIRNSNFLLFSQQFDKEDKGYWHFKMRFESWNRLSVNVFPEGRETFFLDLDIKGTSEDFRKNSLDGLAYEYFFCKVIDSMNKDYFLKGDTVVCFYYNGSPYVSKYIGALVEPDEKMKISIIGMGGVQTAWGGDKEVSSMSYAPRAKDFKL